MSTQTRPTYLCRSAVNWKGTFILMLLLSALWALVLFLPRQGGGEKDSAFFLLLLCGLGLDFLILYSGLLRSWTRTWIEDGVIFSRVKSRLALPKSGKMRLDEVVEACFVYNGWIGRKKLDSPNSKQLREMKARMAEKIDEHFASRRLESPVSVSDERYDFSMFCGSLFLKDSKGAQLQIDAQVVLDRANFKEVKKFLSFLPADLAYAWRIGKVRVRSSGSGY